MIYLRREGEYLRNGFNGGFTNGLKVILKLGSHYFRFRYSTITNKVNYEYLRDES